MDIQAFQDLIQDGKSRTHFPTHRKRRWVPWRSPRRHRHSPRQRCSHCGTGDRVVSCRRRQTLLLLDPRTQPTPPSHICHLHIKAAGHIATATAFKMQDGNNIISAGCPRQLPANRDRRRWEPTVRTVLDPCLNQPKVLNDSGYTCLSTSRNGPPHPYCLPPPPLPTAAVPPIFVPFLHMSLISV